MNIVTELCTKSRSLCIHSSPRTLMCADRIINENLVRSYATREQLGRCRHRVYFCPRAFCEWCRPFELIPGWKIGHEWSSAFLYIDFKMSVCWVPVITLNFPFPKLNLYSSHLPIPSHPLDSAPTVGPILSRPATPLLKEHHTIDSQINNHNIYSTNKWRDRQDKQSVYKNVKYNLRIT